MTAPDLSTRLAEWQRLARAATAGPWGACGGYLTVRDPHGHSMGMTIYHLDEMGQRDRGAPFQAVPFARSEDAAHIATWSPDRALLVVEALRATVEFTDAKDLWQGSHCRSDDFMLGQTMARAEDKMRAALNALAALDSP
jgi:hypothetical protein